MERRVTVVGIAGGVASGKSVVSRAFERLGGIYLDVDRLGHEVLGDAEVQAALRAQWGEGIFEGDQVSRPLLAQLVFGATAEAAANLRKLEQITHPRIGQRLARQLDSLAEESPGAVVILDAAVMFKAGWDRFCDKIVFVDSPEPLRLKRALSRGWTEAAFRAREKSQVSVKEKRNRADIVIDNSGDIDQTYQQVRNIWNTLSP